MPSTTPKDQSIYRWRITRPVQWFFDNLLPEEGARELLASGAKIDKADAFGLLETFGAESAGAMTLLPPNEEPGIGSTYW
ncbi:HipA N-terminal domain-containing protein [Neptunomonas qingdaonensis]|uniref:Serine/threonine-protein kinase HipA n=1 Tax=Neptunomonas qingdaonensis TaxID=1045558 RepID=A0A1I2QCN5_9GAMM|nr:HipA N-terminal domain-containing protein [Neptunomonas qingdaonensis]SFG25413.1 serine/threonine-protein kinase HipA [Neptunomonas qingdaonensis]